MGEVVLFNINDITVLFGGFLSLVLAALLIFRRQEMRIKRSYWICLAVFFFLNTLHALDTLVYWSININAFLSSVSANFFFVLGFAFFLQGPLLYWFTKAAIYRDFHYQKTDLLHLVPVLFFPVYIYLIYYRFDADYKLQYVHDWSKVTSSPYFELLMWGQRTAVFIYGSLCVFKLYQYVNHLKATYYSLTKVDLNWLKLIVGGFFIISTWGMISLLESRVLDLGFDSLMGEIENHLFFVYMAVLVIFLLQNSNGFAEIEIEHTIATTPAVEAPHQQLIEKLQVFMETQKPYLEPHITVERLATKLQVSPKMLSSSINGQLNKNFFEMIGSYRLEEAKKHLADPQYKTLPINEIMKNCGFSSKSVFNQAFKKNVGVTPSHFRQQHLG